MYYIFGLGAAFVISLLFRQHNLSKENDSEVYVKTSTTNHDIGKRIFNTLIKMQCQPERIEDHVIHFGFQGQQFQFAIPTDGTIITRLWYPGVGAIDVDSPHTLDTFESINLCKQHSTATIYIGEPEEDNRRYIHIFFDMVAHHEIINLSDYIRFALNECFNARQALEHFTEIKANASRQNRRPVGFGSPEQAKQETTADSTIENKTENHRRTVGFTIPQKEETVPSA